MSLILRSLMRDPLMARAVSRPFRRYDDDLWLEPWSYKRARAPYPYYGPDLVDDMNRQMSAALNRMHDFAQDLEALDSLVNRVENEVGAGRRGGEVLLKRTESGDLQIALDVSGFKPEDLKIQHVDDSLVIEAVSESSGEDSFRRNHFKRWFRLPEDCKVEEIKSKLTPDNKLLIDLPGVKPVEQKSRNIPIEMVKPAEGADKQQAKGSGDSKK